MTPQEKDLIQGVFDRLQQAGVGQKDAEAEALIADRARRTPDAAYGLTQAVIVLEIGLNQAQQRIAELQRQLDATRQAQPAGGSFLGGASPWGGSVPRSGAQQPVPYAPQPQQQQPGYAPPPGYAPGYAQQPGAFGGGGFLRNAAMMAAGVAGGTLIAEGLTSLFSGGHGYGGMGGLASSPWGANPASEVVENVTVNNYYGDDRAADTRDASYSPDPGYSDNGVQDASYDDGGFDGGGFDGGFDGGSDA